MVQRRGGQLLANLRCEVIVRIGLQPAAHCQPFRRFITIPALLGRPAPSPPRRSPGSPKWATSAGSVRKSSGDCAPQATASSAVAGRLRAPWLADKQHAAWGKALLQQLDCACHPPPIPRGPHAGGNIARLAGDISAGILVHKGYPVAYPELLCPAAAC